MSETGWACKSVKRHAAALLRRDFSRLLKVGASTDDRERLARGTAAVLDRLEDGTAEATLVSPPAALDPIEKTAVELVTENEARLVDERERAAAGYAGLSRRTALALVEEHAAALLEWDAERMTVELVAAGGDEAELRAAAAAAVLDLRTWAVQHRAQDEIRALKRAAR